MKIKNSHEIDIFSWNSIFSTKRKKANEQEKCLVKAVKVFLVEILLFLLFQSAFKKKKKTECLVNIYKSGGLCCKLPKMTRYIYIYIYIWEVFILIRVSCKLHLYGLWVFGFYTLKFQNLNFTP